MKKIIITTALVLGIVGCKTTEPLYYYGEYNTAVYSYLKGEETTLEEQILVLEETVQLAAANGKSIAPGVHAHLGMLYFESGNAQQGEAHFETEKQLFPESTQYIDFLLTSAKGA
ncbi:DUF4810 domain-containing protein [Alteromonas sp. BL110]|nr:DUF4810 domain-containing protein [Alteromonas sp. BL110]RKM83351.1 DUF4810 domain-containing protein [Alteromonas sp. BL110]